MKTENVSPQTADDSSVISSWAVVCPDNFVSRAAFAPGYFRIIPDEYGMDEEIVLAMVFFLSKRRKKQGWKAVRVEVKVLNHD